MDNRQLLLFIIFSINDSRHDCIFIRWRQGSSLPGYHEFSFSSSPVTNDDPATVDHNPSPSML
jgi:hypothetical protein